MRIELLIAWPREIQTVRSSSDEERQISFNLELDDLENLTDVTDGVARLLTKAVTAVIESAREMEKLIAAAKPEPGPTYSKGGWIGPAPVTTTVTWAPTTTTTTSGAITRTGGVKRSSESKGTE